jgi:hypothetical protein
MSINFQTPLRATTLLTIATAMGFALGTVFSQARGTSSLTLPRPFATPSAVNFPKVIGWPKGAVPHAPTGFRVDLLAADLEARGGCMCFRTMMCWWPKQVLRQ